MAQPATVPPPEPEAEEGGGLDTVVAVLIAVSTLAGAGLAWRSSVAGDGSGDADYAGLRAVVNVEETRAVGTVNAYESYASFTSYARQKELARLQEADHHPDAADSLMLAKANRQFDGKFANRDGSYAVQRELGAEWADAAREKDLNPEPSFEEAEKLSAKSLKLLLAATVVALALVFFTLVEPLGKGLQYVNLGLGILCLLVGAGLGAYYELTIR